MIDSCRYAADYLGSLMAVVGSDEAYAQKLAEIVALKTYTTLKSEQYTDVEFRKRVERLTLWLEINHQGGTVISVENRPRTGDAIAGAIAGAGIGVLLPGVAGMCLPGGTGIGAGCGAAIEGSVSIKTEDGVTNIYIQNLNFYVNANEVQQLNVNPQMVKNIVNEKLYDFANQIARVKMSAEKE